MLKMNTAKAMLVSLVLLSCAAFFGCAEQPAAPSEPEVTVTEPASSSAPDASAQNDYLIDVDLTFPDSKQQNTVYMFFVKQDGTVLTTQYNADSGNDFIRKKALLDPGIFDLADPVQETGRLTEAETGKLTAEVAAVDPESERYKRPDDEPTVDVEETYHLTYAFRLSGQSTQFVALSRGEQKGTSIRSEDPHAAAAISVIEDSALFQQWLQDHISGYSDS